MPETYPPHLIPNTDLSILSDNDINKSEHIGVWADPKYRFKDEDGKLNGSVVDLSKIPHFSCNKIPNSVPRDLKIEFTQDTKKEYLQDWSEGQNGLIPKPEHFNYIEERNLYFLKIDHIEHTGEYYNPFDDYSKSYSFYLKIIHKPSVSNYWHFEFEIDSEHAKIEKNKNRWINELCGSIRGHIVTHAIFELP